MDFNEEQPKSVITWSPCVDRPHGHLGGWFKKLELLPPFLQKKRVDSGQENRHEVTSRVLEQLQPADYCTRDSLAEEFFIYCWDDCKTAKEICSVYQEQASAAKIAERKLFEKYKVQDQERSSQYSAAEEDEEAVEEEEEEEEEEGREEDKRKKRKFPWSNMCTDTISVSETEEEVPDTVDPYISHQLYIPYNQMPRPKRLRRAEKKLNYKVIKLPRRPRSPVRKTLPGKFDLRDAYGNWRMKQNVSQSTKLLEQSKQRISKSIKQLSMENIDKDVLISTVILETICEEVTLTLMGAKIDLDVHTFVNVAVIWALSEFHISIDDGLTQNELHLSENFFVPSSSRPDNALDIVKRGRIRKVLLGAYRPPFSYDIYTTLHRRLPWCYVCPSHERSHIGLYPNVRERIDETVPNTRLPYTSLEYVPDVKCIHLKHISEKPRVAYSRKSKLFELSSVSGGVENLFDRLMSFL